jgi:diguanylate cyclase (GGDEF)-like protein
LLFVGVGKVTRLRSAPGARESGADAAIVAVAVFALSWQLLLSSYAHDASLGEMARIVTLAFPVLDIGVLFIVVNAMMVRAARRPADTLLACAVVEMLVADFLYGLVVLHSGYESAQWVHPFYLVNYVLLAAAAAHPSTALAAPQVERPYGGRLWLPLVGLAMSVSPGLVLVCALAGVPADAGVLAGTTVLIVVLAVLRASWLVRRLRRQADELAQRGDSLLAALATQQELENDIRHQAFHDSLTGLANRALLQDRVEHALEAATRRPGTVALCFCDLDGFKEINDGCGHLVGDQLLLVASKRIASVVRSGDTVARLGGDEFAVLLENVEDPAAVTALAERIVWVLRQPVTVDDRQLSVSASVGVAFAGPNTSTERLLAEADAAMYEAKANGKDQYALFETEMRARLVERMTLTNAFRTALQQTEFYLEFQPQVRLTDGALEGFEALVRWQHPTLGMLSPLRFIPLAEDTGFIVPLGRWVLEQACLEAAGWRGAGSSTSVAVNVSSRQLQNAAFCQDVRTALSFSGLPPQRLVVEITESVLMVDPAATAAVLAELKQLGVRIAIDDFGTGYSSLSYLRQFPTDILKIDKSFIDLLDDPSAEARALIQTILRLAEDLHLDAVAEGIEHEQQRAILQQLRCPSAQGYLMSRPLSSEAARAYIAAASAADDAPLLAS